MTQSHKGSVWLNHALHACEAGDAVCHTLFDFQSTGWLFLSSLMTYGGEVTTRWIYICHYRQSVYAMSDRIPGYWYIEAAVRYIVAVPFSAKRSDYTTSGVAQWQKTGME